MIKGLYTAASGMMLQMARQDAVANNLANVNTSGFKKQTAVCRAFPEMLISRLGETRETMEGERIALKPQVVGGLGTGACIDAVYSDLSMGNLRRTDNPTDLALGTQGYYVVDTPEGIRYTRSSEYKINGEGYLTTREGYPLLDIYNEPVLLEDEFTVDKWGSIIINGEELTRLQVVTFPNLQAMERLGDNLLSATEEPLPVEAPSILQGYVEDSNVSAVQEMVTLITVVRAYETLQKMVQAEDETLDVALNEVGRVV